MFSRIASLFAAALLAGSIVGGSARASVNNYNFNYSTYSGSIDNVRAFGSLSIDDYGHIQLYNATYNYNNSNFNANYSLTGTVAAYNPTSQIYSSPMSFQMWGGGDSPFLPFSGFETFTTSGIFGSMNVQTRSGTYSGSFNASLVAPAAPSSPSTGGAPSPEVDTALALLAVGVTALFARRTRGTSLRVA